MFKEVLKFIERNFIILMIPTIFLVASIFIMMESKNKVNIIKNNLEIYNKYKLNTDVWLISRVINQEVSGCSVYDKIAVASSILNRLDNGEYGNSISEVIFKKHQYTISDTFTKLDLDVAFFVYVLGERDCDIKYFFNPKSADKKHVNQLRSSYSLKLKTKCHEYY